MAVAERSSASARHRHYLSQWTSRRRRQEKRRPALTSTDADLLTREPVASIGSASACRPWSPCRQPWTAWRMRVRTWPAAKMPSPTALSTRTRCGYSRDVEVQYARDQRGWRDRAQWPRKDAWAAICDKAVTTFLTRRPGHLRWDACRISTISSTTRSTRRNFGWEKVDPGRIFPPQAVCRWTERSPWSHGCKV